MLPMLTKLDNEDICSGEREAAEAAAIGGEQAGELRAPAERGASSAGTSEAARGEALREAARRSSSNILYAVMALLPELDEDGLRIVLKDVEQKLAAAATTTTTASAAV